MKAVLLIVSLCCISTGVWGFDETLAQQDDERLASLAVSESPSQQVTVLETLAMRYRQPGDIVIKSKIPVPPAHPKDTAISPVMLSNVLQIAKGSGDIHSRIAAMDVLKALMPRTNITAYVQDFLDDSQVQMRLRACGALIDRAEKKDSTAISGVPACLAGILAAAGDPGTLTVASQYAAGLGSAASSCVPELTKLKKSSSKEVRSAAAEALKRIQTSNP